MGFRTVAQWAASPDSGKWHITTFRKQVSSASTTANDFIDYTYSSGNPPANFYASSPLQAAHVPLSRGINIPAIDGQFLKRITVMSASLSAVVTNNQNQRLLLADYLLYYPFIDTDSVGEEQTFIQSVSLPRYTTGDGVQIIAVSQSAATTVGTFTINYTNSDGVAGRTSRTTYTKNNMTGGGTFVSSTNTGITGSQCFIELQAGDKGVRSIESVTFTGAGGGLMCLVLIKPLYNFYSTQECRRTTSGNLESYGAATQFETVLHGPPVEIKNGAVLGIIGLGNNGTLASSVLTGVLETTWS